MAPMKRILSLPIASAILILLAVRTCDAQLNFHVQPKTLTDTILIRCGNIPYVVDLKQIRFESTTLMKYLELKTLPAGYSHGTFATKENIHYVFAFPGACGLLDVSGFQERGRCRFAFHVSAGERGSPIRSSAPLAVSAEGLMVTLTDSSIHLQLPDGAAHIDRKDLPAVFFDTTALPLLSMKKDIVQGTTFYQVQISFLARNAAAGAPEKRVLHCLYQAGDDTFVIHRKYLNTEESSLSLEELEENLRTK